MAHTNETPNYGLSQFIGTDKASWLGDINPDMSKIDSGMYANKTAAESAESAANTAQESAQSAVNIAENTLLAVNNNIINTKVSSSIITSSKVTSGSLTIIKNKSNTMLNMRGNVIFSNDVVFDGTNIPLFTTDLRPTSNRVINVGFSILNIKSASESEFRYANLMVDTAGVVSISPNISLGSTISVNGYVQLMLTTYDWY